MDDNTKAAVDEFVADLRFGVIEGAKVKQIYPGGQRPERPLRRCRALTEVYSRVCGFFRPVQQWNKGKREEYKDRKVFKTDRP